MRVQRVREVPHGPFGCQPPPESPCRPLSLPKSQLHAHHHHLPGVETALGKSQGRVFGVRTEEGGVFGKRGGERREVQSPDSPTL